MLKDSSNQGATAMGGQQPVRKEIFLYNSSWSIAYHKKAFTSTQSRLSDYMIQANKGKAHSVLKGSSYPGQ